MQIHDHAVHANSGPCDESPCRPDHGWNRQSLDVALGRWRTISQRASMRREPEERPPRADRFRPRAFVAGAKRCADEVAVRQRGRAYALATPGRCVAATAWARRRPPRIRSSNKCGEISCFQFPATLDVRNSAGGLATAHRDEGRGRLRAARRGPAPGRRQRRPPAGTRSRRPRRPRSHG